MCAASNRVVQTAGKSCAKNAGTALGELVEDEGSAGQVRRGWQGRPVPADGSMNDVRGRDRGSDTGDKRQPDRCRELLERIHFPRTAASGSEGGP